MEARAAGLCWKHYQRLRRTGSTASPKRATAEERFWAKVEKLPSGCWIWAGSEGHALFRFEGRPQAAHRVVLLFEGRELGPGDVVHHICKRPSCVNPAHLEVLASNREHAGKHRRWTRENVIAALQQWSMEHGGEVPTLPRWAETRAKPFFTYFYSPASPFKSWASAVEAAGFPRPSPGGNRRKRA